MKFITTFLLVFPILTIAADYPAPVKSAKEARETRAARANDFIEQWARVPLAAPPTPPKMGFAEFIMTMIARMKTGTDLDRVSENILTPTFHPWLNGTDISTVGSFCKRVGDYDFIQMGLIRMAYIDLESGDKLLTAAARDKLRHELLNARGTEHHVKFGLKNCPGFIKIRDTENHIMMTEFSRYLTNQILFKESGDPQFDNSKNGFEEWLLNHLSEFMRTDFDEFNSRPYQGYTMIALSTLASYAEGPRVKLLSTMILDYLSAKAAIQSKGLRRFPPFRRQLRHRDATNFMQTDNGMFWYSFHAANSDYTVYQNETPDKDPEKQQSFSSDYMFFMAATDKYEIPDMILDLFYDQNVSYFQSIRARDIEIYHNSPSFLLTAGGRYRKQFGYFTRENDAWAMPTTIIPANSTINVKDVFAINGEKHFSKKNNLCVAPGFACGMNLSVPRNIPASCIQVSGKWKFYDLKNCELKQDIFVATYEDGAHTLLEVRETDIAFKDFKDSILRSNPESFEPKKDNQYTTSDGRAIVFTWKPKNLDTYPIKSIDGKAQEADISKWDYAIGNVLQSKGDGLIVVRNPMTGERMEMDQRDILNPRRAIIK